MAYSVEQLYAPFQLNTRVRVVKPISETEKQLLGREFVVRRISKPHGYVVAGDEHGDWHLHPEALQALN